LNKVHVRVDRNDRSVSVEVVEIEVCGELKDVHDRILTAIKGVGLVNPKVRESGVITATCHASTCFWSMRHLLMARLISIIPEFRVREVELKHGSDAVATLSAASSGG